jgi:hypothetical protein
MTAMARASTRGVALVVVGRSLGPPHARSEMKALAGSTPSSSSWHLLSLSDWPRRRARMIAPAATTTTSPPPGDVDRFHRQQVPTSLGLQASTIDPSTDVTRIRTRPPYTGGTPEGPTGRGRDSPKRKHPRRVDRARGSHRRNTSVAAPWDGRRVNPRLSGSPRRSFLRHPPVGRGGWLPPFVVSRIDIPSLHYFTMKSTRTVYLEFV